jgi:hypothetical protein
MKKLLIFSISFLSLYLLQIQNSRGQERNKVITPTEFHISLPLRDLVKLYPVDEQKNYGERESEDRKNRPHQTFL